MSIFQRIRKAIGDFLNRLGQKNSEAFDGEVPDCCKINRKTEHKTK
jgi:hypothetical protein